MKFTGSDDGAAEEAQQRVRLQRFLVGAVAHVMNLAFIVLCWSMGFLSAQVVALYAALDLAFNIIIYSTLRSGLNKRFKDPSLTSLQVSVPALFGFFVMYFAGQARAAFLLLGLGLFSFGILRFKTRGFIFVAIFLLAIYALLIALLAHFHATTINLKIEFLLWVAFAMTMAQFSFLAALVGKLRRNVGEKTRQLAQQNVELETALQRIGNMAVHDELTGVYNRRYLMQRITEEAQRCLRSGSVFSICMVDIDLFKKINDTYGHLSGDEVLRCIANTATKALRPTDFFGRYGGEEFLMVLADTPTQGAMVMAERIREKVEQLAFPEIAQDLHVTISIGVAEHVRASDSQTTLKRADEALYRAKESGRNRSVQAPVSQ